MAKFIWIRPSFFREAGGSCNFSFYSAYSAMCVAQVRMRNIFKWHVSHCCKFSIKRWSFFCSVSLWWNFWIAINITFVRRIQPLLLSISLILGRSSFQHMTIKTFCQTHRRLHVAQNHRLSTKRIQQMGSISDCIGLFISIDYNQYQIFYWPITDSKIQTSFL